MSGELGNLNTKNWEDLEALADSLELAWKGGSAELEGFLPPLGTAHRALILQELIKTDLECRWRKGQGVPLDHYLEKFGVDLGPPELLPAALIFEEYRVRQLFGDNPPLAEYQARFPAQFPEIERLARENPAPTLLGPAATPPSEPGAKAPSDSAPGGTVRPPELTGGDVKPPRAVPAFFTKNSVLTQTGGYTLMERIGTGGFAEVWRAQAPGGVLKAIKIIIRPIGQVEAERERESMELIKNLRHHFLLPVHAFWALEDRLIILMDLADCSLRDRLNKYKREGKSGLPLSELMDHIMQAAEALDYLHGKKVQHRDIKPENILLTEGHVRVADFGLAKHQGTQRLMSGTFAGTPLYMPPETWEDKFHTNGDQYSLAATYYELRTGRRLFNASGLPALMHNHLHVAPALDLVTKDEQRVLQRALSKNPEARYPTCVAFAKALKAVVKRPAPATATPPHFSAPLPPADSSVAARTIQPPAPISSPSDSAAPAQSPSTIVRQDSAGNSTPAQTSNARKAPDTVKMTRRDTFSETSPPSFLSPDDRADDGSASPRKRLIPRVIAALVVTAAVAAGTYGTYVIWSLEPVPSVGPRWLASIAAMPPAEQIKAVEEKLRIRNPAFSGTLPQFEEKGGVVTSLTVVTDKIEDLEPLKALKSLSVLKCNNILGRGQVTDLAPLQTLHLTHLECAATRVDDLTPLEKMGLIHLDCSKTNVSSLTPLKQMKSLRHLNIAGTKVTDLSPLEDLSLTYLDIRDITPNLKRLRKLAQMPLEEVRCTIPLNPQDAAMLMEIKALRTINGVPKDEWHNTKSKY